jgi:hypothetical protein
MVEMKEIEEGRMELCTFQENGEGGIEIEGGRVITEKGEFEKNDPKFKNSPSFRRNIHCVSGEIEVKSLKGGDGVKDNFSLCILSSGDCILKGIPTERLSPLFIPSISNVGYEEKEEDKTNHILIFSGSLFFPCIFNFTIRGESYIEGKAKTESYHLFTNIQNRERGERRMERIIIDSISWDVELNAVISFPSFSSSSFVSSLPNLSPLDDKKTESGGGVEEESGGYVFLFVSSRFVFFHFPSFDEKEQSPGKTSVWDGRVGKEKKKEVWEAEGTCVGVDEREVLCMDEWTKHSWR